MTRRMTTTTKRGGIPVQVAGAGMLGLLMVIIFAGGSVSAYGADLVVDGTTLTLSGDYTYDNVVIRNGGVLSVGGYDGTAGTGQLVIRANSILVDASSSINADGRGFRGVVNGDGEGPEGGEGGSTVIDGGGGGGYGGSGGRGVRDNWYPGVFDGDGGAAYGSPCSIDIQMGSAGGSAGTGDGDYGGFGGNGGGAIWLEVTTITIAGTISANGDHGQVFNNDASGGGAGGGILLSGRSINVSGTLRANGGNGATCDDGGGGGAGGRIKIFYASLAMTGSESINGGLGGRDYGAEAGEDGTICHERVVLEVSVDIKPGSDPNAINLGSNGVIPVAIFSTPDFDATTVDPTTVELAGAGVAVRGKGKSMAHEEDVDGDGLVDLVCQVETQSLDDDLESGEVWLTGETFGGQAIEGCDVVVVVPPE